MTDPEQELQAEDGGDIGKLAGQLMGLCFLVVAAVCVCLGKLMKRR